MNDARSSNDTANGTAVTAVTAHLRDLRRRQRMRSLLVTLMLGILAATLFVADLAFGHEIYPIGDILKVLGGEFVPGLSFTIGELRLPRVVVGLLAGFAFGVAGVSFQQMLRNTMASPDIIGITAGANLTAVFAIIVLGWSGPSLSAAAVVGGILTALLTVRLAWRGTFSTGRLILMGIGVAAALNAATSWILVRGDQWNIQQASRWLTGSLASSDWSDVPALAAVTVLAAVPLIALARQVDVMRFGDPMARGLGVRVESVQMTVIVLSVLLLSTATASSGPISFVSFLSGPLAMWLNGPHRPAIVQSGLVGSCIVLAADIVAQHIPPTQLPVGVVTSIIAGPILILLIIRLSRKQVLA